MGGAAAAKLAAQGLAPNLGLNAHATFSGALAWPYLYPWPQRPPGLVEAAFDELARRWRPILDAFDEAGVDVCYEIHPGEDLHDGATLRDVPRRVNHHPRANLLYDPSHFVLQQLDYLAYIDLYHSAHPGLPRQGRRVQPAPARQGVYGGFQSWINRAGRFRSLGDGQVDFGAIFCKLTQYGFDGWAVLEWECCIKDPRAGRRAKARRSSPAHHPPRPSGAFDDFAAGGVDGGQPRARDAEGSARR